MLEIAENEHDLRAIFFFDKMFIISGYAEHLSSKMLKINPAVAGPPRRPPAAAWGGISLPPFTSASIASQRDKIEKRKFAHTFLNT